MTTRREPLRIKNAQPIQVKSRIHHVEETAGYNAYKVTSGSSGEQYIVNFSEHGSTCSCPWGTKRSSYISGCSHVVAVNEYLDSLVGRRISVWISDEDAARQHRPARKIGDGVILTSRKKTANVSADVGELNNWLFG